MRSKRRTISIMAVFFACALLLSSAHVFAQEDLPLRSQLSCVGSAKKGASIRLYRGATLTAGQRKRLNKAIKRIRKKKANVGFVMMNLQTGKMITYNPTKVFFGASTVKGPYTIAVNRSKKGAWKRSGSLMRKAVINSNNACYLRLRQRYGNGPMISLHRLSGLSAKKAHRIWPYPCARDLAKLWCGSYSYLKKDKPLQKKLRRVFSRTKHSPINTVIRRTTYSKPGWMLRGSVNIYNDAGIVMSANGPYVIAVMTSLYGNDHKPIRGLVRTLDSIQETM